MKNITDEILNKYIDGELSSQEIDDLEKELAANSSLVDRLKALKMTDTVLKTLEHDSAPENVAHRIMQKIESLHSVKNQKPYLIYGLGTFIAALTLATIAALIFMVPEESGNALPVEPIMEKVTEAIGENATVVSDVLQNPVILLIGASLTLVSLIAGYYLFDAHKSFKKRLDTVTH